MGNVGDVFQLPANGVSLAEARIAIERLRGIISIKRFSRNVAFGNKLAVAWITVKESRQHGHHIYSVEAIKLEALDRKVEVVSGNTPHASSASTRDIIAKVVSHIKGVFALSAKARHEKHG